MESISKTKGFALATAAAALFMAAPLALADDAGAMTGKCFGVNACKGQGACKTAHNACKGQNACKGEGFLMKSKAECDKMGGKFESGK